MRKPAKHHAFLCTHLRLPPQPRVRRLAYPQSPSARAHPLKAPPLPRGNPNARDGRVKGGAHSSRKDDQRTRSRMRFPPHRVNRLRLTRILTTRITRSLINRRIPGSRARFRVSSAARAVTSRHPVSRTRVPHVFVTRVVALATWLATAQPALLKRKRSRAPQLQTLLRQQAKALRKYSRLLRLLECVFSTRSSTLAPRFHC